MRSKKQWLPPDKIRIKSFITGCIVTALIMCSLQTTEADVGDNLGSLGVKIAETLGVGKEARTPDDSEFKQASLTEKLNYLEAGMSSMQNRIANIEFSSSVSNELQTTQLLDSFKSSGKTSVAEWSSSYNLQKALATSDIAINSEQSGYMLD